MYAAIDSERAYQNTRWNSETTTSEGLHSLEEWFTYIEDYVSEAKHVLSREARQTADRFRMKGKARRAFLTRAIRRCFRAPRQS